MQHLTPEELSKELHVNYATLLRWRKELRGPRFLKVGRKVWYRREDVDAWLASQIVDTE